jgi:ubiquinone/menaquinone biosynthesis C-methylase UbiE
MSSHRSLTTLAVLVLSLLQAGWPLPTRAQEASTTKAPVKTSKKVARRDKPRTYMGRVIAPVMTYEGADWLVRDSREQEERPDAMLDALKIQPGSTVADVGAGVGYTSVRLSKRVGPNGTVLATDLQPEMLKMLAENARNAGVKNIKPLRSTPTETKLPENAVDLVLMVDVYHECSQPEAVLKGIRKALKPRGRLVLVEFRGEDPEVPIKEEHKMTLEQVRKEVEPQGFSFKESLEFLPWQHIIIFEKAEEKDPKKPAPKTEERQDTSDPKGKNG